MQLLPIHTPLLKSGDSVSNILISQGSIQQDDIIVISSKVIATVEGTAMDLSTLIPSEEARKWSEKTGRSPAFCEAVLMETKRMNGMIAGSCPGALLTELRPRGLGHGSILTANAGLDESNIEKGFAIGWPADPVASVSTLRSELQTALGARIAVLITDSCCRPRRWGVTAFALTVAGLDPLESQRGREDLFGRPLRITTEAVADQLATAANFLMGNAGQSIPAVIIRDHGLTLSESEGWVPAIDPKEDLFREVMSG